MIRGQHGIGNEFGWSWLNKGTDCVVTNDVCLHHNLIANQEWLPRRPALDEMVCSQGVNISLDECVFVVKVTGFGKAKPTCQTMNKAESFRCETADARL